MKSLYFLLCCGLWLAGIQLANAGIEEPKPVYKNLYVSVYEQRVLLNAIQGKEPEALQLFLADAAGMDKNTENLFRLEIEEFALKMKQKQAKSRDDKAFAKQLFYNVHQKFLKKYLPLHNFSSLLSKGTYNCLTATALYAIILDELDISFQIYETDYHIFLLVKSADGEELLFETTDPLHGFVEGQEEIALRIKEIQNDAQEGNPATERPYFDFDLQVMRPISLQQLAGLQYYNRAAQLYNTRRIEQAALVLSKGRLLYQAERFDKLAGVLSAIAIR